jgi:hypothetical protein
MRGLPVARYVVADSKALAVARMYSLGEESPEPLGPGSKEKKSALVALGKSVGLDLSDVHGKGECGRRIAEAVRVPWDEDCHSAGDTVTLVGMNRLLDGVVDFKVSSGSVVEDALVSWLMSIVPVPSASESSKELEDVSPIADETKQDIADRVSRLSQSRVAPGGYSVAPEPFDDADVTFDDGRWRERLADVEGWLRLARDLTTTGAQAFDESLRELLGMDHAAEDVEAFEALASRLERAVELCEKFEDDLEFADEGEATVGSATKDWSEAWDEVDSEAASETSGPIRAESDTLPIRDFIQWATDGELELSPPYQRADVWPTGDAQSLIESVLRGIPLPSIILLQSEDGFRTTYEVVDGKQRLTSILRFTARHPKAVEFVRQKALEWNEPNLVDIFQSDYPLFKKMWKKHEAATLTTQVERGHYFPFPLRSGNVKPLSGELEGLRGKYYSQIRKLIITVVGNKKTVESLFDSGSKYKLPVILYQEVTSSQIHEVFSLYNKQGKHLNAEEIRNALYHELSLVRALLATSGDADNVESVAPFLLSEWADLGSTQQVLNSYEFKKAGYKRTKLLSWVAATLLFGSERPDSRSTAGQINAFLDRIKGDKTDPMRSEDKVLSAMLLLDHAIDAHAVIPADTWDLSFKVAKGNRWQELQLVATLVALAAARIVYGADLEDVVEARLDEIAARSATDTWRRPKKTQSKAQWKHTADVVADFLAVLDVDVDAADQAIRDEYGHSGLKALLALAAEE